MKYFRYILIAVLLVATIAGCRGLGAFLHREDPLQKVDVIFVLGGQRLERVVEAGDLYREGWTSQILLSEALIDDGERELKSRGLVVESQAEFQRGILARMGVPREHVLILNENQTSTAAEAGALLPAVRQHRWRSVMIVTSRLHTRRAALAARRRLEPEGVVVITRAPRTETRDLGQWWTNRDDLRFVLFEIQTLAAYWAGIAD